MPQNIEIKAHATDWDHQLATARAIGDSESLLIQEDIFFACNNGRLKLRIIEGDHAELIHYHRPNRSGPKTSDYALLPVTDPQGIRHILATAYGEVGVIRKRRTLVMVGQTRVHFDEVESLGKFIELEVVLGERDTHKFGEAEANRLIKALSIHETDLIPDAYVDIVRQRNPGTP